MTSGIFWVPVPKADPFLLMIQTTSESSVLLEEGAYEVRSKLAKTGIMSSSGPRLSRGVNRSLVEKSCIPSPSPGMESTLTALQGYTSTEGQLLETEPDVSRLM